MRQGVIPMLFCGDDAGFFRDQAVAKFPVDLAESKMEGGVLALLFKSDQQNIQSLLGIIFFI